jgi:hypothetical protein
VKPRKPSKRGRTPLKPAGLVSATHEAVARLRTARGAAAPLEPLAAGVAAAPLTIPVARLARLFPLAFAEAAGAPAAAPQQVVWVRGDNELLVRAAQVRLLPRDGLILIGIPVFTEQSGDAEIVVTFAVGSSAGSIGLIMAAEAAPRGHPLIVLRWGDELTAAAWLALVKLTTSIAAAMGVDDQHVALIPAALAADSKGITVVAQARHSIDRGAP